MYLPSIKTYHFPSNHSQALSLSALNKKTVKYPLMPFHILFQKNVSFCEQYIIGELTQSRPLKTYIIFLRRTKAMAKPTFDPDVYELQLARILLDTLLKKDAIGLHTYKVTERKLNKMEECENEHGSTVCSLSA